MSTPIAYPDELGVYLALADIDLERATLLIALVQGEAESIVSPLPAAAKGRILAAAGRAYTNITSAHQAGIGSAQISYGAPNAASGVGGLYLSKSDIAAIRRMAGRTGAFTIDPTPADAGDGMAPWDQNVTWLNGVPLAEGLRPS